MSNKEKRHLELWSGLKHDIPLCCIFFFDSAWWAIRHETPEYGEMMHGLTDNAGVVLCPECLVSKVMGTKQLNTFVEFTEVE